uniref:RING-type domain-containing protein n=1 Tax=viral metagenome TaxID=1070528 RepID=A0A6C0H1Y5_9ZZZZ
MGNIISNQNIIKPECLICWETIENQNLCMCIRCNITLHDYCEKKDRGKKEYCKCPHCRRPGTMGVFIK